MLGLRGSRLLVTVGLLILLVIMMGYVVRAHRQPSAVWADDEMRRSAFSQRLEREMMETERVFQGDAARGPVRQ